MEREKIVAIMEEMLFVSDEWGGSKLANWRYGFNVVVEGIEDTADAIIASASKPAHAAIAESRCEHEWGIDGMHQNEYCKKCFTNRTTD